MRLLIIILLFPILCYGQYRVDTTDTSKWPIGLTGISTQQSSYMLLGSIKIKQDTIPVIILCSDTSAKWFNGKYYYNPSVEWRLGYEVRKYYPNNGWSVQELVGYLDDKKNPMPNKIIVWMTKEIKN